MELRHVGKKGMRWGHRKAHVQTQIQAHVDPMILARNRSIRKIMNSPNSSDEKIIIVKHYMNYGQKSTNKLLERMDKKNLTTEQAAKEEERVENNKILGMTAVGSLLAVGGLIGITALKNHIDDQW